MTKCMILIIFILHLKKMYHEIDKLKDPYHNINLKLNFYKRTLTGIIGIYYTIYIMQW